MTKSELINKYAKHTGCTKKEAEETVNFIFDTIRDTLAIVKDLPELIQVMVDDKLTEFQYVIEDEKWNVILK